VASTGEAIPKDKRSFGNFKELLLTNPSSCRFFVRLGGRRNHAANAVVLFCPPRLVATLLFGKSWIYTLLESLKTTLEENLAMI
jgi:hypothetical protein